ncbi:MAG: glycoside hydrolase family 78 protein [Chitinophagaceae bacterium]|nr:glycoside hydrolase family 78 protein [Chitinophagaceae bacterium]
MIKKVCKLLCFFILLVQSGFSQVQIQQLRCELLDNPQGIDVQQPALSWQLDAKERNVQQFAYQIIVSESLSNVQKNIGDCWNSGKINASTSVHVVYGGKPLQSGKQYFWKVKAFTNKGNTLWSNPAFWSMGLLQPSDWKGKWIGYDKASPWDSISQWSRLSARYLRKKFQADKVVKRATLHIVGLGLYELHLNGVKVSDRVLAPLPTDYRKTVLSNSFDVTRNIKKGSNVVAVVLGNGRFFTMRQNYKTAKHNTFGYPKMLLQLDIEYANGSTATIPSDESWKLNVDGPIRTNNEYDGEEYDATKAFKGWTTAAFNDADWINPELVNGPVGKIVAQMTAPMKVKKIIQPKSITPVGGKYIVDMGQNFAGWVNIRVSGKRGWQVKLRFAESLLPTGELYVANLRDAKVTDKYTLSGEGVETWHPSFVYHGFRYVEVSNYPGTPNIQDFEGQMIFDDMQTTGSFSSSDTTLNSIVRNAWWGIASNYKGMPVDCPQRNERQPWLGDRATGAAGEAFLFDNATLYAKWLNDIEQAQTPEGAIPDVAPAFWNYYSDNITWPGTYIMVADMLYLHYGDERPILKHYASMKLWMDYMQRKYMKNYIVTKDKYGDWCVPPESLTIIKSKDSLRTTKGELIATAYYYRLLQLMKKYAGISKHQSDSSAFEHLSQKIATAFQQQFYHPTKGCYDNNTVTANLLPLYFGITPDSLKERVFANIQQKITVENQSHISTGVIGTQWLMRGLTKFHSPELAYTLATNTTYPSWGYMVEQGATTVWELWNGNTANPEMNSQNHVMLLGDLLIWLYENVAGIQSDASNVAFHNIVMKPSFTGDLKEVNASYQSQYGKNSSYWKKEGKKVFWTIGVPANASATVYIPASDLHLVKESGIDLLKANGVKYLKIEDGNAILSIGSGEYVFEFPLDE